MKVRCVTTELEPEQANALGWPVDGSIFDSRLRPGDEYPVIGLTFDLGESSDAAVYVYVLRANGSLAHCHLALFEVTDSRASRHWHLHSVQFAGRRFVELLPPHLFDVLGTTDDDVRSGWEQERDFARATNSADFQETLELLRTEFD